MTTATISQKAFFEVPVVKFCQDVQKKYPHGTPMKTMALRAMYAIAKLYQVEKWFEKEGTDNECEQAYTELQGHMALSKVHYGKKFSVKASSIKYLETRRGVAFTAKLYFGDTHIGDIENGGQGGGTDLVNKAYGMYIEQKMLDAVKATFPDEKYCAKEQFLERLMDIAEAGVA